MRFPEFLELVQQAIQTALPDSSVAIGNWAATPNVDAVYVYQIEEQIETMARALRVHVDHWTHEPPVLNVRVDGFTAWSRHDAENEKIEKALQGIEGAVSVVFKSWQFSEDFIPRYMSRLIIDAHLTTECDL